MAFHSLHLEWIDKYNFSLNWNNCYLAYKRFQIVFVFFIMLSCFTSHCNATILISFSPAYKQKRAINHQFSHHHKEVCPCWCQPCRSSSFYFAILLFVILSVMTVLSHCYNCYLLYKKYLLISYFYKNNQVFKSWEIMLLVSL